jgi:transferase CAF17, mitochondrial
MASGLATRAICAKIPNRAFLSVTGTNSAQLLNGLITTTVPWPPIGGFYSAFLAASVCDYNCPTIDPK